MSKAVAETAFGSIEQTMHALDKGELTSQALVEAQLTRIERLDSKLHACVDVYASEARAAARGLDHRGLIPQEAFLVRVENADQ